MFVTNSLKAVVLLLLLSFINSGCAKTMQVNKLPQQNTQPDVARIYIFRPSIAAYALNQSVYQDNIIAGQVGARGFIGWDVKPGATVLQGPWGFVKVLAQPGKTYYFKMYYPKLFAFGNSAFTLSEIPEHEGIQYLGKLKPPKINIVM